MAINTGPKIPVMVSGGLGDLYLAPGNQFLRMMQALIQCNVLSVSLTAPPGSPANGDTYIVGAGATGLWAGKDLQVAYWTTNNPSFPGGVWEFWTPKAGWLAGATSGAVYTFNGAAWVLIGGLGSGQNIVPGNLFGGVEGGTHRNTTLFVLIPGCTLTPVSSFKLILNAAQQASFPGHNIVIGGMAILKTGISKNVVLSSTPVLIGGSNTPTIAVPGGSDQNNPQIITTDAISLALDNSHDYYFAVFFSDVADNGFWDMSNCPASPLPSFFNGTGNKVGNATIPIISSWGTGFEGRFLSRVVVP